MSRKVTHRYTDPLDLVWLHAARALGWKVRRSSQVYASWDGRSELSVSTCDDFDPDDSLAQLLFHEICHALVAGPLGMTQVDWGLNNTDARDIVSEHATHRLQAALAAPYGLREFFAVTTDHRAHWDSLPEEPLRAQPQANAQTRAAIELAQQAHTRSRQKPFAPVLHEALETTAAMAALVRGNAASGELWALTRQRHVTGFPMPSTSSERCGDCAWAKSARGAEPKLYCLQAHQQGDSTPPFDASLPACERWEPRFSIEDCGQCGACCRQGFDLVQVGAKEAVLQRHPDWVAESSLGLHIPRPTGRCPGLSGCGESTEPYRCTDYEHRPQSCCDFEVGDEACLVARRRVGLSR